MADLRLTFARSARKELEALSDSLALRILQKIEALAAVPRPAGCRKIQGSENLWRIRVGDYRVVYAVQEAEQRVDVIAVRHRKDAYR